MGLIERLRKGSFTPEINQFIQDPVMDDAADALKELRGYAEHQGDCEHWRSLRHQNICSCGLTALLHDIGD